eukprot:3316633-Pyramimonas_sp.AAC.1
MVSFRIPAAPVRHLPRPPWGVMMISLLRPLETHQSSLLGTNVSRARVQSVKVSNNESINSGLLAASGK